MELLFWLREHVYRDSIVNPPTVTGLELPQNSLMMVGTWPALSPGVQAKITKLSVEFQENCTFENMVVVLVAVNPSGGGTVCMYVHTHKNLIVLTGYLSSKYTL